MKGFLSDQLILLRVVGTNATTTTTNTSSFVNMAQKIADDITPPITISIKNEVKQISPDPCIDLEKGGLILHEFILRSFVRDKIKLNANVTFQMPFYIWGNVPSVSFDLNAPGTLKIQKLKCSKLCTILDCNYRQNYFYSFIPLLLSSLKS